MECYQIKNCDPLAKILKDSTRANPVTPYVCMALYQKCTLMYKNKNQFKTNIGELFKPILNESDSGRNNILIEPELDARMIQPLLFNEFNNRLKVCDENWQYLDLASLLVQIKFSVVYARTSIIGPLRQLIMNPIQMIERYSFRARIN